MCGVNSVAEIFVKWGAHPALLAYKLNVGEFPSAEEGLKALVEAPAGKERLWKGPYLVKEVMDSWGNPYQYRYPTIHKNVQYDLYSFGSDGIENKNDIANWKAKNEPYHDACSNEYLPMTLYAAGLLLMGFGFIILRRLWIRKKKNKCPRGGTGTQR